MLCVLEGIRFALRAVLRRACGGIRCTRRPCAWQTCQGGAARRGRGVARASQSRAAALAKSSYRLPRGTLRGWLLPDGASASLSALSLHGAFNVVFAQDLLADGRTFGLAHLLPDARLADWRHITEDRNRHTAGTGAQL